MIQPSGVSYDQANRGVTDRWVSEKGDGSDEIHWQYDNDSWTTTAPDGSRTEQLIYTENGGPPQPYGFGDAKTGRPYETRSYSTSDQLLSRSLTAFETSGPLSGGYSGATRDMRPTKEISIVFEPGNSYALASMTETVYDTGGNSDAAYFSSLNPKQQKKYHYVVVSASTATSANIATAATWFSSSDLAVTTEMDYLYDSNYKARNITGLVTETRVKDPSGNVKAKSQIFYDELSTYPLLTTDTSVTTGHWTDPSSNYRGLVTTTKSWTDITNNLSIQTHAQYDQLGNLRKSWNGNGNLSQIEYSSTYDRAYPTKTISPIPDSNGTYGLNDELETVLTYDLDTALPLTVTDPNGGVTEMEYEDDLYRPTKTIAPNDAETITEYGAGTSASTRWVKVKTQIDSTNWKEAYSWFDGLGRGIRSQSVDANSGDVFTLTCYDNMSRVSKASIPFRNYNPTTQNCITTNGNYNIYWTTNTFDTAGRPWKVTTPDGAIVETTYGLAATSGYLLGSVVTVEDQADKQRRSVTNALGQLKRVDEPTTSGTALGTLTAPNQKTEYDYDLLGNLSTVTQGLQTRTFTYDALSRLKQAANPESGTINYAYDSNGNLTQKTDARGVQTDYVYDRLNRVTNRNYSTPNGTPGTGVLANYQDTPDVSYYYDILTNAKGKLIKVTSSVSTTEYTSFDILGRVTGHKQTTDGGDSGGYTTSYVYNLGGALIEETYPSTRVVKNVLDSNGDMSIVQSKKNSNSGYWNYADAFTYNAAGAVTSMQLGNGRWESTVFNSRLQPTQIALGTVINGTDRLDLDFTYNTTGNADNNGNILSQTITVPGVTYPLVQTYTYDPLNRIETAIETSNSSPTWKQKFSYDRYGNRRFDFTNGETTVPASNCAEAICNPTISTSTNRITSSGYSFDAGGNTTADAQSRTFVYDAENKQTSVSDTGGTAGQYFYDGDGKRVKKYVPGTGETTVFVYDAAGKQIAEYSTIVASTQDAKVAYLTNDHLGSPRINTDADGSITARHDYLPFGEEITSSLTSQRSGAGYNSDAVRKKFTGYERDGETELDFANARMYSYSHGRFPSPDPILSSASIEDPQSWNRYSYTLNNPLRFTDPTGMFIWTNALGGDREDDELTEYFTKEANKITNEKKRNKALRKVAKKVENIVKKRNEIRAAITAATGLLNSDKLSDNQKSEIKRSIEAYGEEGDNNNVILGQRADRNGSTMFGDDGRIIVTLGIGNSTQQTAIQFLHEGSHLGDFTAFNIGEAGSDITEFATESRAWTVSASAAQGFSMKSYPSSLPKNLRVWKVGWSEVDVATAVSNRLAGKGYNLTPQKQGDSLSVIKARNIETVKARNPIWNWY